MKNPFLFVVGCQRSGTTLLQHVLDSHPDTAIMQEAGWFGTWYEMGIGMTPQHCVIADFIPILLRTCKNIDLGVSSRELLETIASGGPYHYRDFVSTIFDRFGAARGKLLAGSKNPDYLRHLPTLHHLWPDAKFIHIIRDGRDVCLCAADRWKNKPGFQGFPFFLYESPDRIFDDWEEDPVTTSALWWEWTVGLGRRFGRLLGSKMYYEMRYEDLVTRPREECIALCAFLGLAFDEAMLRHEENFKPRRAPGGKILHARVGLPITSGLRNWRTEMTAAELGRFEAAAGSFLDELRYERGVRNAQARDCDRAAKIRELFDKVAPTSLPAAGTGKPEGIVA